MTALPLRAPDHVTLPPLPTSQGTGVEEIRVLTGHSGAHVALCRSGEASLVRKRAGTPAANARLTRQADKQRLLAAHGIPLPRVLAEGIDAAGLAYFDMEYVPACTLASTLATAGSYDTRAVLTAVDQMLWLFSRAAGGEIAAETFAAKIDDVARSCLAHPLTASYAGEIEAVRATLSARNWAGIPGSPSHGDLTLENILVSPSRGVVFIDCDEPFASSFWLDAGKLFQDLSGYWCLRHMMQTVQRGADVLNAIQKVEKLAFAMRAVVAAADARLPQRLAQLAALSLFRTLPYARDEGTVSFVLARLRHVLA
jgi:aminoglycoside phosphotransferase